MSNLAFFTNTSLIVKIVLLVLEACYVVFSIVLSVQVNTLNKTVAQFRGTSLMSLFTTLNVLAALSLFAISVVIL